MTDLGAVSLKFLGSDCACCKSQVKGARSHSPTVFLSALACWLGLCCRCLSCTDLSSCRLLFRDPVKYCNKIKRYKKDDLQCSAAQACSACV